MSIINLKRRAQNTVGASSANGGQFIQHGNHRNPSSVVGGYTVNLEILCTPEDSAVFKTAVKSNAGMIATRFPKRSFTVAKDSKTNFPHSDYMNHIKRMRLAKCPDPVVKTLAEPTKCVSASCNLRNFERVRSVVPNMPGKTGARDYSEWLERRVDCSYSNDPYTLLARANALLSFQQQTSSTANTAAVAEAALEQAEKIGSEVYAANDVLNAALRSAEDAAEAALAAAQAAVQASLNATSAAGAEAAVVAANAALNLATEAASDALAAKQQADLVAIQTAALVVATQSAYQSALDAAANANNALLAARAYLASFN